MSEDVQGFRFRATPRVPFSHEVRLRFDRIGGSVSGRMADLSTEGMFVATGEYKPIGTLVQFEFENEGGETVQGLADIVWIREVRQGADREPGMGLHFRYVDPRSRELIAAIVRDLLTDKEQARETAAPSTTAAAAPAAPIPAASVAAPVDPVATAVAPATAPVAPPTTPLDPVTVLVSPVTTVSPPAATDGEPEPETAPQVAAETVEEAPLPESEPALPAEPAKPERAEWALEPPSQRAGAPAPLPGAVWTGSDEWLRPEPKGDERSLLPRGAGAARRARIPFGWLLATLLVSLAVAAGFAYYRRQTNLDPEARAPVAASPRPTPTEASAQATSPDTGAGEVAGTEAGETDETQDSQETVADGTAAGSPPPAERADETASTVAAESPVAPTDVDRESPPAVEADAAPTASEVTSPAGVLVAEPVATPGTLRLTSDAGANTTVVRIASSSEIRENAIRSFRLESPPRFVVQVRGAEQALPGSVTSPLVSRVRIGVHPATAQTAGQPEIHFVFDLATESVRARASILGGAVVVTFSE